jgi:hypothetical protein
MPPLNIDLGNSPTISRPLRDERASMRESLGMFENPVFIGELALNAFTNYPNAFDYYANLQMAFAKDPESITSLNLTGSYGQSVVDISGLPNINAFIVGGYTDTSISARNCSKLIDLQLQDNGIMNLDLSGCVLMDETSTNISFYYVNNLDLSGTAWTTLNLDEWANIKSVNMSDCSQLTSLSVQYSNAHTIIAQNCTALTSFNCDNSFAHNVDLSGCVNLSGVGDTLAISNTVCKNLDVSRTAFVNLDLPTNIETVNISGCINILEFPTNGIVEQGQNQYPYIKTIDASNCTSISTFNHFNCYSTTEINLSGCESLTSINVSYDYDLIKLDVSGCSILTILNTSYSGLSSLDVSSCAALATLYCYDNTQLTALDLRYNPELIELDVSNTLISELDLRFNLKLENISIGPNIQSVDQIFIDLDNNGRTEGYIVLANGQAPPTALSLNARNNLSGKGWTIQFL